MGLPRHPDRARDRRQRARRVPPRRGERRAVDAVVALLPRHRRRHHLLQDRAVAEHARAASSGGRGCSAGCRSFFARYAFRHPAPRDFFAAIEEGAGRDLAWFFDETYRQRERGRLRRSSSSRANAPTVSGIVERNGAKRRREGQPARRRRRRSSTELVVRRYGEAVLPVDVLVTFADGGRCASGGTAATAGASTGGSGASRADDRAGGSGPHAAARRELHQQLVDAGAAGAPAPRGSGPRTGSSGCRTCCSRGPRSSEAGGMTDTRYRTVRRSSSRTATAASPRRPPCSSAPGSCSWRRRCPSRSRSARPSSATSARARPRHRPHTA